MRLTITTVAMVLGMVSIYAWGGSWLQNLGTVSILVLWYFAAIQPPKKEL
jgi:preprotein translocase subunit SecF